MKKAFYILLSAALLMVSCTPQEQTAPEKDDKKEDVSPPEKETSRIILSAPSAGIGYQGGEIEVKVTSNVELEVILPDSAPWISLGETKALTETVYTFIVEANPETSPRHTDIAFVYNADNLKKTVHIVQDAYKPEDQVKGPGVYGICGLNFVYEEGKNQYLTRKDGSVDKFIILDPVTQKFLSVSMLYTGIAGTEVDAKIVQNVNPAIQSIYENVRLKVMKTEGSNTFFSSLEDDTKVLMVKYSNDNPTDWSITGTMVFPQWDTIASIPMTLEDDWWVARGVTLTSSDEFKFIYRHSWEINRGGNIIGFGTPFSVYQDGPNIIPRTSGTFDIYMNADTFSAYLVAQ